MTFLSTALLSVANREFWIDKPFSGVPSVVSDTTYVTSTTDGPMVFRYDYGLTVNEGSLLTPANRCKGLAIFVKGNLVVNGTISMTARGAAGAGENIAIDYKNAEILIGDPNYTNYEYWIGATGGTGGSYRLSNSTDENFSGLPGSTAINNACGGGGGGGTRSISASYTARSGSGSAGTSYSGGCGGGGAATAGNYNLANAVAGNATSNGGAGGYGMAKGSATASSGYTAAGGGAGNPGGAAGSVTGYVGETGTGGLLIIIVKGNVIIGSTGMIQSNGSAGGAGSSRGWGGCSGGGSITLLYTGTYTNNGTIQANGGLNSYGGAGGAGSIRIEKVVI